ncbi:MAG: histidine phosphatase family protein [Gammaproteobacteria bacterium]|nr:histidine phosphatase family protein [Gammaproteobacteria bacterium]NIQ10439.1 histidine phosphatase family protein [Gammaproteobacteria bacterium]NIR27730.1 histidine phosphatase family protein [Gammaproteobacteria bacterium]NIY19732.1 histidine phosphatase family protein [Gammaproteobacteria bacterium]
MKYYNRMLCCLVVMICQVFPICLYAQEVLDEQQLIRTLQQGGYNLYLRHEATDWSQHDKVRQRDDWLSCDGTRIRQLSEQGRQRARRTGQAMRNLNIPVSEVLASPYCRAMETAQLMNLGGVQPTNDVINLRVADYFGGRDAVVATARELLSRRPKAGSNRVIVAHGNVAQAATPVYPGEGEVVIFKPGGEGHFSFVGRIEADGWRELSQ